MADLFDKVLVRPDVAPTRDSLEDTDRDPPRPGRFTAKGPYICFGARGGLIGGFPTLAEAKRACGREELASCGQWKKEDSSHGVAYYAQGNGCTIVVGYDHPQAAKFSREEIEKATARFRWRESLR